MAGRAPDFVLGREREGGVEEALAGAVERDHLGLRVDGDAVAAAEPAGDGVAQLGRALVRRVERELAGVRGDGAGDEIGQRVLRLADGHGELGPARGRAREQPPQARKGVFRQVCEPRGKLHRRASSAGVSTCPVQRGM